MLYKLLIIDEFGASYYTYSSITEALHAQAQYKHTRSVITDILVTKGA